MELQALGWDGFFESHFDKEKIEGGAAARVVEVRRGDCRLLGVRGELTASLSGRLRRESKSGNQKVAVGDWVVFQRPPGDAAAIIQRILPRKSKFSRKVAGETSQEQILAANIDVAFLVTSLNLDLNPRRLERYLALTRESGAKPVILLTKADLCKDAEALAQSIHKTAAGTPIHAVSSMTGAGMEALDAYLGAGKTAVFLGSSGAGKSSLINRLAGSRLQRVREVRAGDERGRHTTSSGCLIILASGAMVIDTPGLRELQLWEGAAVDKTFDDVAAASETCRFRDCRHGSEPGCAVRAAVEAGTLDPDRLESYLKLQAELAGSKRRAVEASRAKAKQDNKRPETDERGRKKV